MLEYYKLSDDKHLVLTDEVKNFTYVLRPTREEIGEISNYYDFPFDYLSGILDDHENARFESDDKGNNLMLLQYPAPSKSGGIGTFPYSLVWAGGESVILALNHECDLQEIFERKYDEGRYQHQLIFYIMKQMTQSYHDYLRKFRESRKKLEIGIKNSTRNDQIIDMIAIQESLIYFEDALHNNINVLTKLIDYLRKRKEDGFADKIYDILVENDQAYNETKIQLKLLENLRDLFSNIVSNNLNIVMKIMTSATFVLGIPAVIVGFYGMNVPLWHQTYAYAGLVILGVIILVCGWVSLWLRRLNFM